MARLPLCAAAAAMIVLPAAAAEPPAMLPGELDALTLVDQAVDKPAAAAAPWRAFVEAALGRGTLDGRSFDSGRVSLDLRYDDRWAPSWRAVLSNRFDATHRSAPGEPDEVNTLREAYLSWSPGDRQTLDFGRINVRQGVAMGFNPTDWFKEGALRSVVTADPAALRENRQGTVALQGQHLWGSGALTALYSPGLGTAADDDTFAFDAAATNPRDRWALALSQRIAEGLSPQLSLQGGGGRPVQAGLNVSTVVGDSAVVFAELASGKGDPLTPPGAAGVAARETQHRAAVGLTYTTSFKLSLTLEGEYNSAGLRRADWAALDAAQRLQVLGSADRNQDLPVRQAWFVHATWADWLQPGLDLSAYVRHEDATHSRDQWLELRYRRASMDLSLQWQQFSGGPATVFGAVPQRRAVEAALRYYF